MKKTLSITLLIILFLTLFIGIVQAQENRGTIQGLVYQDVDGDGLCVDTGVEGEEPVEGVNVEFTSSDEETVITLFTDEHGIYGLFAAGQSYWQVAAKPSADWVVTSENPLYAPLDDENRAVTGVNFCVRDVSAAGTTGTTGTAAVILPESGGAHVNATTIAALAGVLFVAVGAVWEIRRRTI